MSKYISSFLPISSGLKLRHTSCFLSAISCVSLFGLVACGGGGGGGGAQKAVPVTYDGRPTGTPLSPLIWVTNSDEYEAQKGLADIQVNAAYLRGFSGRDIKAGVVDSGVDGDHSEFGSRLSGGGDWQSEGQGLDDPNGHGTHVAGILGAMRDDTGIHGVAPEALIYSYRILNNYGYLPYSLGTDALIAGLRILAAGETYMPVEMMGTEEPVNRRQNGTFTGRERDVLNGLLTGLSNKEIAREHGLSEVTIKHHLKSLRSKLGARNRTHAVCRAIELGITEEAAQPL